jgi:hypothetical protein
MTGLFVKLIIFSCVFLKIKMTVTIGESLYTLSIGKIAVIHSATYDSQVISFENCKLPRVDMWAIFSLSSKVHGMFLMCQEGYP